MIEVWPESVLLHLKLYMKVVNKTEAKMLLGEVFTELNWWEVLKMCRKKTWPANQQ